MKPHGLKGRASNNKGKRKPNPKVNLTVRLSASDKALIKSQALRWNRSISEHVAELVRIHELQWTLSL